MAKKLSVILIILILSTGCATLKEESYESILNTTMNSNVSVTNTYRAGYKYYLPKGMRNLSHEGSNEILALNNDIYYMYVDRVSYYNKVEKDYEQNSDADYSKSLQKDNLFGYIEIKNAANEQYFIEIMYNYAKIEVIVDKDKANEAIAYAMSILTSISYQDEVLTSLMGEDVLKTSEIEHNIFESADTESGYLQIVEEYGQYEEKEEVIDPDFIRK